MSRAVALLAALALGCDAGTPLVAAEGGSVTSDDGVLTLVFPPGALSEDTPVSIRALTEEEWPVGAPGRFTLLGGVYAVEPAGLELAEDAYAVVVPPNPEALAAPDGGERLAVHYVWSPTDEKVRPAPASQTWRFADGRVAVIGTVYDLGTHWVGDRIPGADRALPAVTVRAELEATDRAIGEEFAVIALSLASDVDHVLFERSVTGAVVRNGPGGAVPIAGAAWTTRTWDATVDPELGLHALAHFAAGHAQEETLARFETREPLALTAGEPFAPFTSELPAWRCESAADDAGAVWLGVDVVTGASAGVVRVGSRRELGAARCR